MYADCIAGPIFNYLIAIQMPPKATEIGTMPPEMATPPEGGAWLQKRTTLR
jgi:hypothetical protein